MKLEIKNCLPDTTKHTKSNNTITWMGWANSHFISVFHGLGVVLQYMRTVSQSKWSVLCLYSMDQSHMILISVLCRILQFGRYFVTF